MGAMPQLVGGAVAHFAQIPSHGAYGLSGKAPNIVKSNDGRPLDKGNVLLCKDLKKSNCGLVVAGHNRFGK